MIDSLDGAFSDSQPQPARRYALVPAGACRVEIVRAEHKAVPWRASDANPSGNCIALRLRASSDHGFVFADLPDDKAWLRKVGRPKAGEGNGRDSTISTRDTAEALTGLQARVEIEHITTRAGEIRAVVKKWLPALNPQPPAASRTATLTEAVTAWVRDDRQEQQQPRRAPPPPVKRSPNAVPHYGADDDIPF